MPKARLSEGTGYMMNKFKHVQGRGGGRPCMNVPWSKITRCVPLIYVSFTEKLQFRSTGLGYHVTSCQVTVSSWGERDYLEVIDL